MSLRTHLKQSRDPMAARLAEALRHLRLLEGATWGGEPKLAARIPPNITLTEARANADAALRAYEESNT